MKQDMELVRKILIKIEENPTSSAIQDLKIDGYDAEAVAYHCKLLHQQGLVESFKPQSASNLWYYRFWVGQLTSQGHEYLNKIRDNTVWSKVKKWIKEKGLPLTIEAVKDALIALI